MQYIVEHPVKMKLYYNKKVYSPKYSSSDTILLVDKLIKDSGRDCSVMDVGCGSGVIGLGVKLMNPSCDVQFADIDPEATRITELNGKRLGVDVWARTCDMLPPGAWDIIVANLPTYTDEDLSQELHGPKTAYYAGKDPLRLYKKLFNQAQGRTRFLVCECQEKYQEAFIKLAEREGWALVLRTDYGFAFFPAESLDKAPKEKLL